MDVRFDMCMCTHPVDMCINLCVDTCICIPDLHVLCSSIDACADACTDMCFAYRQQMPYYRDYIVMAYVVMACVVMAVHGLRVQAAEQSTVAAYSYGAL